MTHIRSYHKFGTAKRHRPKQLRKQSRRTRNPKPHWHKSLLAGIVLILLIAGFFRLVRIIEIQSFTIGGMNYQLLIISTENNALKERVNTIQKEYQEVLQQSDL